MNEPLLLRLSLLMAIVGLGGLFVVTSYSPATGMFIGDLSIEESGRFVKICGDITEKRTAKDGHVFFQVTDGTGDVPVVFFHNTVINLPLDLRAIDISDTVCIEGRVDEYRGSLEVIGQTLSFPT